MSHTNDNDHEQDDTTMENENTCRDLQRYRGFTVVQSTHQYFYHDIVEHFYRNALAASLRPMVHQLSSHSLFRDAGYDSLILICHSNTPDHGYRSYRPRAPKIGTASGTKEVLQVEKSIHLQQVSRLKIAAQTWLTVSQVTVSVG